MRLWVAGLVLSGCGRDGWIERTGGGPTRSTGTSEPQPRQPLCEGSVPLAAGATVVLEHDRCACAVVALDHSLPGVVFHDDVTLGPIATAVGGWVLTDIVGEPEATLVSETEAFDLAREVPYDFHVRHALGLEAGFRMRFFEGQLQVDDQWFGTCVSIDP